MTTTKSMSTAMAVQPNLPSILPAGKPTVAFTTPPNYASRISHLLTLKGFNPLWCPSLTVQVTPFTISNLKPYLSPQSINPLSAIAFTSRTSIVSVSDAIADISEPPLSPHGDSFILAALGKDSELIDNNFVAKLCRDRNRVKILVPSMSTPSGLVKSLGDGRGRRVLCPVPVVIGVEEPPVVPNFIRELEANQWVAVRVGAYETRWAGRECAKGFVRRTEEGGLDAVVFTSTAEVEGLLKSLKELGLDWRMVRRRCPGLIVAAHGPVTAAGAERLGVRVDLVSDKFDSFEGVVNSLYFELKSN